MISLALKKLGKTNGISLGKTVSSAYPVLDFSGRTLGLWENGLYAKVIREQLGFV